jgi:hypothetical protein
MMSDLQHCHNKGLAPSNYDHLVAQLVARERFAAYEVHIYPYSL